MFSKYVVDVASLDDFVIFGFAQIQKKQPKYSLLHVKFCESPSPSLPRRFLDQISRVISQTDELVDDDDDALKCGNVAWLSNSNTIRDCPRVRMRPKAVCITLFARKSLVSYFVQLQSITRKNKTHQIALVSHSGRAPHTQSWHLFLSSLFVIGFFCVLYSCSGITRLEYFCVCLWVFVCVCVCV